MENRQVKLKLLGITFSQVQTGAYAMVLSEENGNRRLPVIIGTPEAQSIAIFLEGLTPPRPLTHDLFVSFLEMTQMLMLTVSIYKYEEGVFYSNITFIDKEGNYYDLDSRASDAVALAIRVGATIITTEEIMQQVGIDATDSIIYQEDFEAETPSKSTDNNYEKMSLDQLQEALTNAISREDYETASQIRDIIKTR